MRRSSSITSKVILLSVLTGLATLGCSSSDGRPSKPSGLDGGPDGLSLKGDAISVDSSAVDRMAGNDGAADQLILDQAALSDGAAGETSRETLASDGPVAGDASPAPDSPRPSDDAWVSDSPRPGDVAFVVPDSPQADGPSLEDLALGSDSPQIIGPQPGDAPIADTGNLSTGPDSLQTDGPTIDGLGLDSAESDGPIADLPAADLFPGLAPDLAPDLGVDAAGLSRSWSAPKQLAPTPGSSPSVAVDPVTGNAVVVWADLSDGVMAVRYTAATDGWSDPVAVSSDLNMALARVAVDAHGHWLIVWSKRGDGTDASSPGLWASFSSDATNWSSQSQLFVGGAKNFDSALRVAMNRGGQAMIVWDHYESPATVDTPHKLYALYLEGTTPRSAALIGSQRGEYQPDVAIDGTGRGIIAWSAPDTTVERASAWAATFSTNTVSTPALLENYDSEDVSNAVVAMNAAGQGIAVWAQKAASTVLSYDIYSRRTTSTGSWASTPELVAHTNTVGNLKSIVMDNTGNAHLAWSRGRTAGWQCAVSTQPLNGSWSSQDLETDNLATGQYVNITEVEPSLALDASGNLLVGWRKKVSDTEFVPNFRWRIGNLWGPVVQTGLVVDLFSKNLALAVSDNGRAVAAWTYHHCDPGWQYASTVCPTAKTSAQLSTAARSAWGMVHATAYR